LESIKEQNNTILENIKELVDSSTKDGSSNLISSNYLDSLQQFFEGKLLNKESIIKCKFIKSEKRELVMDIKILAFDIECYLNNNNHFIPYACGFSNGINTNLYYLTDYKDSNDMLQSCLIDILTNYNKYTIYVHNFSNFDYYFIINLLKNQFNIKSDPFYKDNKLYSLKLSLNINNKIHSIIIKDSYLLLPNSLRKLGKDYNVNIPKTYFPYTFVNENNLNYIGHIPEYFYYVNNINNPLSYEEYINIKNNDWSTKNETLLYLKSDLLCLYEIINKFSKDIFNLEGINITKILSISSLTFKIFKTNYLNDFKLPIIKGIHHDRIRYAFYGGHVDVYKPIGNNIKYYDVNSLYPHAMCNPMPFELIRLFPNMNNIKLENFFCFCLAQINCPKNMLKPVLPYKHLGKTIYPTGCWIGIYFSEELKAVQKLGYKITLIKGYEFSKLDLFSDYIKFFYSIKKNSTGPQRFIAKMHLNQLYGYFGRKLDLIETINVFNKDLILYAGYRIIKNIIKINNDISTLLMSCNINQELINELNSKFELNLKSNFKNVKTNVAIASAVTSYARIHMIPYKLLSGTVYTDTDSIFTTDTLPDHLIGTDLGLMKDELDGNIIQEAYFLGIKQYGYKYLNNNQIIEKSTFAGVPKNSLTFNEIIKLFNGDILIKLIPIRFFKSIINLEINIKPTKITIKKK
jgi:hypothetical protein